MSVLAAPLIEDWTVGWGQFDYAVGFRPELPLTNTDTNGSNLEVTRRCPGVRSRDRLSLQATSGIDPKRLFLVGSTRPHIERVQPN